MNLKAIINNQITEKELDYIKEKLVSMDISTRSDFLQKISNEEVFLEDITSPNWLISNYSDDLWVCKLETKTEYIIDYKVFLDDGSLLTDIKNQKLLNTFKYYLCILTSRRYNGGRHQKLQHVFRRMRNGIVIIDSFLTRSKEYKLGQFGLEAISKNEIHNLFSDIYKSGTVGAYNAFYRISIFLKEKSKEINKNEVSLYKKLYPQIDWVPSESCLSLSFEELVRSRIWLLKGKYFANPNSSGITGNLITKALYKKIFKNNIRLPYNTPNVNGLRITQINNSYTEYKSMPVSSDKEWDGISPNALQKYLYAFKKLAICNGNSFSNFFDKNIFEIEKNDVILNENNVTQGRFRTIPAQIIFKSMENGFEFIFNYADIILESIVYILDIARNKNNPKKTITDLNDLVKNSKSPRLDSIGVTKYSTHVMQVNDNAYFKRLRSNEGLIDLYEVLLGSILVILGSVIARRQGEIVDLLNDCISPAVNPNISDHKNTSFFISFYNRKSGDAEDREKLSRPIPRSVAGLIWKLILFKENLTKKSIIEPSRSLWVSIKRTSPSEKIFDYQMCTHCIDIFCDYFETPILDGLDGQKYRYYLRQHQLRRFFAMAFFWGSGYEGLGTLRYFLGHTDTEHLYHYITETIPGSVLKGVQAQRILYGLTKDEIDNKEQLRDLLLSRFGVSEIEIRSIKECVDFLEDDYIDGYIETSPSIDELKKQLESNIYQLLTEGVLTLEPNFLKIENEFGELIDKVHLTLIIKDIDNDSIK